MKAAIVLVACFAVLGVNAQELDLDGLEGTFYSQYIDPDRFDEVSGVIEVLNRDGDSFTGTFTGKFEGSSEPETYNAEWQVSGRNVVLNILDGPQTFNGEYEILAQGEKFFIAHGLTNGVTVVHLREQCPCGKTVAEVRQALDATGRDLDDFARDPSLEKCPQKEN